MSGAAGTLLACPDCDLLHREQEIPEQTQACCERCGAVLYRSDPRAFDRALALSIASALLLAVAHAFPVMVFSYAGSSQATTIVGGVIWLAEGGLEFVALLVFATSVLFPALRVCGLIYCLLPLRAGVVMPYARSLFRTAMAIEKWSMLDVYALAILVAVVKLGQLAEARIAIGTVALVGAAGAILATGLVLDVRDVWRRFEAAR